MAVRELAGNPARERMLLGPKEGKPLLVLSFIVVDCGCGAIIFSGVKAPYGVGDKLGGARRVELFGTAALSGR